MTPDDIARLEADVQRALDHHTCARLMPGELRELIRLARIGRDVETPKPRGLHEDNGN